jgi:hypothetical protein
MWTKATDVPKDSADNILERFDKTDPGKQRMIALQYILNAENERERADELQAIANRVRDNWDCGGVGWWSALNDLCDAIGRPVTSPATRV